MIIELNLHGLNSNRFIKWVKTAVKTVLKIQTPEISNNTPSAAVDHLTMTTDKLDYAVTASKHILQEAAHGKLPNYV